MDKWLSKARELALQAYGLTPKTDWDYYMKHLVDADLLTKDADAIAAALADAYEQGRKDGLPESGQECLECCSGACGCPCHKPVKS